jgi:hypothetical protein
VRHKENTPSVGYFHNALPSDEDSFKSANLESINFEGFVSFAAINLIDSNTVNITDNSFKAKFKMTPPSFGYIAMMIHNILAKTKK